MSTDKFFKIAKRIKAIDVLASAPKAYGVTAENYRPQLTSIREILSYDKSREEPKHKEMETK